MRIASIAAVLCLFLPGARAWAGANKLHVDIGQREGESVELVLPVGPGSFLRQALAKADFNSDIDRASASKLRKAWEEVRRSGGNEGVTLQDDDQRVTLSEQERKAVIEISHPGRSRDKATIRVPETAMDALLSGPEDQLDFDSALRALKDRGRGEVIAIEGGDGGRVRVWLQ